MLTASSAAASGITNPSASSNLYACYVRRRATHLLTVRRGGVNFISGEGFFCLEFDEDAEAELLVDARIENAAILSAEPGRLNLRILKQELQHMVTGSWDWQVTQVGDRVTPVSGPSNPPPNDPGANGVARPSGSARPNGAGHGSAPQGEVRAPSKAADGDTKMQDKGEEFEDSQQDTSIDTEINTETWDKLGALSNDAVPWGWRPRTRR